MPLWIFIAAFTARLLVLSQFSSSPHFAVQGSDMRFYHDWALRILGGQWTDGQAFYGLPGYAFLLAGIYKIFGPQPYLVGLIQSAVDASTASLIFIIARKCLSSEKSGLPQASPIRVVGFAAAASLGWILFLPTQTFSVILMPTVWLVCAFWGCVWLAMNTKSAGILWPALGLGLLVGVVSMLVATILFLIPLLLVALSLAASRGRPMQTRFVRGALIAIVLLAGVFAGMAPAWLHNRLVAHEPVLLSAHGGINFWIGNYPGANGYPKIPAGLRAGQAELLSDSILVAQRETGRKLTHTEVSRYWSAKAWDSIHEHPGASLRLLGVKVRNFWNAFQYDDVTIIALLRAEGALLPGIGFGVAATLGLAGMILTVRRNPAARWVAAAVLLHMLALLSVFITERYRLAAVPGLLILGSCGLSRVWESISARRWGALLVSLLIFAASAAWVWQPVDPGLLRSQEPFNLAIGEMEVSQSLREHEDAPGAMVYLDRAQRHLETAQQFAPESIPLLFALGNLWQQKGDATQAKLLYLQVLARDSRHADALNNLGVLAMEEKQWSEAERLFAAALAIEPEDAKTHYLLARTLLAQGRPSEARTAIDAAVRLQPGVPEFTDFRQKLPAL